ncbi:YheC/YheD family protein [Cohnella candidum]|uniref:YheC/YheD family protein n=1 Tax=Cohnella candidum TaxID=2674991 RepID=A0A3G3JYB9_9BACL|nr:YheC/YheD family protein [Cohnella candidum]AYQ73256.1 YheC/YheD family protein [Cohnella candidum]
MRILAHASSPGTFDSGDRPVVAILTVDDEAQSFRGNRANFADLIQTGSELGVVTYVVTVSQLKLKSDRVQGYTYRPEDGAWIQEWFPRPSVIYNRIPLREDERQPIVRKKLAAISRHPGIQMFNRRFFNKWSLFRWLYNNPATRRYVPDTRKLTTLFVLSRLLKRHRLLYLKPVRGKAGVGIMTVRLQPEKALPYRLQIQEEKGSRTYRLASLQRLWEKVVDYAESTGEPYIAQQGISLASVDDRPFDLRALTQKNQSGKWELTGIGARVAGNASITTHVPRGGYIDDPDKLLTAIFGKEKAVEVLDRVRETILLLAKQIERASGSRLGEMSMDLGVDRSGNVWFLEANSKPMKFDERDIRKESLHRIFQYSYYLHRRTKKPSGR